jgi:Fe-S-cluster-containing dehydrogenase component/DMSO reductase anchor subunit
LTAACFVAVSRAQARAACERNNAHDIAEKRAARLIGAMSELARVPDVLAWLMDPERRAEPRYRELVPLSKPGPGEQYAFEVDLDACTGCKSCVSACHTMNGLDEDETWRKVGLLHGGAGGAPWQQTVTTACHHCIDPACLAGCPALAYEKDPSTGIVVHLDDQCIGCRYCTLTCPYDVPQWNPRRGIVRKCDMCHERLGAGGAPACVEACPNGAIRIAIVEQERVIADNEGRTFLPAAPDPSITQPTTAFTSARPLPRDAIPADHYAVRADLAHPPLAVMLVLTQLAVGTFLVAQLVDSAVGAAVAVALGLVALGASLLHLGRPHLAFRAVLGLRRSWLSREIVAFGGFAAAASLDALRPSPALGAIAAALGIAGVLSSVMVYAATQRASWSPGIAGAKFALTTAILGAATAQVIAGDERLARVVIAGLALKLALELALLTRSRDRHLGALQRSARLQLGPLRRVLAVRWVAGVAAINAAALRGPAALVLVLALAGELCERHLFFVAVGSPRMPGGVR